MGVGTLHVFLEAVKLLESPEALYTFPMMMMMMMIIILILILIIIIIIIIIIIPHIAALLCVPLVQCSI